MELYLPGTNGDADLFKWYLQLVQTGDLQKIAGPSVWPIGGFMTQFTSPNASLFYAEDDKGWWAAAWASPFVGGANWGFWLREDKRGGCDGPDFLFEFQSVAFEYYAVLIAVTKQGAVVGKLEQLGYTVLGPVPYLFEGEPCYISYLTREDYTAHAEKWKEQIHGRRAQRP